MTRVRAPGKLVISGAYSVLEGSPAVVTAVDRYVEASLAVPARFVTEEMRAAMSEPFPDFDASALRDGDRKLGLGSSAAILVATLAQKQEVELDDPRALAALFDAALRAHRQAQGGGSGIDVAASVFGGCLKYQLPGPTHAPVRLPSQVIIDVLASPHAASTSRFIAAVQAYRASDPRGFEQLFTQLDGGARRVISACTRDDAGWFIAGLAQQAVGLAELGDRANVPIVGEALRPAAELAQQRAACLIPAGAGGGDVTLLVQHGARDPALQSAVRDAGLEPVSLQLAARGVHRIVD